jgi:hypothetical protein
MRSEPLVEGKGDRMDERSKDPPAEANAAEAGRQHAEADRDKAELRREDKAEQQEAAEGERQRA